MKVWSMRRHSFEIRYLERIHSRKEGSVRCPPLPVTGINVCRLTPRKQIIRQIKQELGIMMVSTKKKEKAYTAVLHMTYSVEQKLI